MGVEKKGKDKDLGGRSHDHPYVFSGILKSNHMKFSENIFTPLGAFAEATYTLLYTTYRLLTNIDCACLHQCGPKSSNNLKQGTKGKKEETELKTGCPHRVERTKKNDSK